MQKQEDGDENPTLRVAIIRFIALLILMVLIAIGLMGWAFSCDHVLISTISGPDNLEIRIVEEQCMSATMQIKIYDKKWHRQQDVFRYEPTGENLPVVHWTEDKSIEIEANNILYIDLQVIKVGNTNILYHLIK